MRTSTPSAADVSSPFALHVAEGLAAEQAFLSSRFIYDERGSKLFQQIMALESYYLTRCEFEILQHHAGDFHQLFSEGGTAPFELIELGAGDGTKTKLLLDELTAQNATFTYRPVDISADILAELSADLVERYPTLRVDPIATTYVDALQLLQADAGVRRVVLFLGSNIGNFTYPQAGAFCGAVCEALHPGDLFVVGVDLRKAPRTILAAYDDPTGVTAAFNLNLLHRLQQELGAELDVDQWGFYPLYNPESGEVRSYLYPTSTQRIHIPALGLDRTFAVGEVIHTEVSRKYSVAELEQLAEASGCALAKLYTDGRGYFSDGVWRKS